MRYIWIIVLLLIVADFTFAYAPFGGPILKASSCCNGLMLTIRKYYRFWPGRPPTRSRVETFMVEYGVSRLIVGQLMEGKWTLGLAAPGGTCITDDVITTPTTTIIYPCSVSIPTNWTVHFIGASIPIPFPY